MDVDKVLLNGKRMPLVGLGTWRTLQEDTECAVKAAIDAGFRHIDCARSFHNEFEVGRAISDKISEGVVTREDLFISSKLWNTHHEPRQVVTACIETLNRMCLDYLDLYLIHWPMGFKYGHRLYPQDCEGNIIGSSIDYVYTWRGMETLMEYGFVRNIGLSNFNIFQVERILQIASIKPVVLQVECHPYLNQFNLTNYCKTHNIVLAAYSPLGSYHTPFEKPGAYPLLQNPLIVNIAQKHKRSMAQVLLRFQLQRGNAVITRTTNPYHMRDNLKVFEFELDDVDMRLLFDLNMNGRIVEIPRSRLHRYYPFSRTTT